MERHDAADELQNMVATGAEGGAELTQRCSPPVRARINPAKTIKKMLQMRSKAGADTPAGHHCSNISELYQNKATATDPEQLRQLAASEDRQWRGLAATRHPK